MPRVYMSDKEAAAAVAVIVESYILNYPQSCTADMVKNIPDRIAKCIEMQGYDSKRKAATPKDSDTPK